MVCQGPVSAEKLLIACPISVQATFEAPDSWFDAEAATLYASLLREGDTFFLLWADPNTYALKRERPSRPAYDDALLQKMAPYRSARVGFEATLVDTEVDKLYILEEIASLSTTISAHAPVTLLDFVRPELADRKLAGRDERFFTVRRGRIVLPDDQKGFTPGIPGRQRDRFTEGISFSFTELERRRVAGG
jgi:hypothetical protein